MGLLLGEQRVRACAASDASGGVAVRPRGSPGRRGAAAAARALAKASCASSTTRRRQRTASSNGSVWLGWRSHAESTARVLGLCPVAESHSIAYARDARRKWSDVMTRSASSHSVRMLTSRSSCAVVTTTTRAPTRQRRASAIHCPTTLRGATTSVAARRTAGARWPPRRVARLGHGGAAPPSCRRRRRRTAPRTRASARRGRAWHSRSVSTYQPAPTWRLHGYARS